MSLFIHHTNSLTIKCSKYLLMCKSSTYFAVRNAAHFLVANRLMLMRLDEDNHLLRFFSFYTIWLSVTVFKD